MLVMKMIQEVRKPLTDSVRSGSFPLKDVAAADRDATITKYHAEMGLVPDTVAILAELIHMEEQGLVTIDRVDSKQELENSGDVVIATVMGINAYADGIRTRK